jgi:hypothetical protein
MPELDPVVDFEQTGVCRCCQRRRVDGQSSGRPPKQRRIPERFGCRQQDKLPRRFGLGRDAPQVLLLDLTGDIFRACQHVAPCPFRSAHGSRQLQ